VSPILVRPVREQFEHDRVIRVLQARYKRKYEVVINPGPEQNASVSVGDNAMYPDLVIYSTERGRKLQATVEVETSESVNTLEAMAEWGPFSRLRAGFHLYVPPNSLDTARRLCAEHQIVATEIWTYHTAADQVRFTMIYREPEGAPAKAVKSASRPEAKPVKPDAKPVKADAKPAPKKPAAKPAAAKKPAKPVAAVAAKPAKAAKKPAPRKPAKAAKRR
jgi:hypothetical protein